jgi:hypothetical protein
MERDEFGSRSRAGRSDSMLTPVDDFRHPPPRLCPHSVSLPPPSARNPLMENGLSRMSQGDARDGMGLALEWRCLRPNGPVRRAGTGAGHGRRDR